MDRATKIKKILIYVLLLNWLVAFAKIVFGFLTKSNSMSADGFHSFSDGASNIVGLIGISFAAKPVDQDHPYGHKKYETFFSMAIGILLFIVCFQILHSSIERFRNPIVPIVNIYSFVVMLLTMGINFLVMNYEYRAGKKLNSDILISDSMHTRADILTSLSVLVALVAVRLGFPIMDAACSFVIAVFIGYSALSIIKSGSRVLCDTAVIDRLEIERIVKSIKGVEACHKIRTRGRSDDIFIDLHVLVRKDMQMDEAHELSERIEELIKSKFNGVADVVVHLEPITSIKPIQ